MLVICASVVVVYDTCVCSFGVLVDFGDFDGVFGFSERAGVSWLTLMVCFCYA